MKWIVDNWSLLVVVLAACFLAYRYVQKFREMPSDAQIQKIKEVLLFWVIEAEKTFKNGTGTIKLRWCYEKFISQFSQFADVVPFEVFAMWVDDVLEQMHHILESNLDIKAYVEDDEVN